MILNYTSHPSVLLRINVYADSTKRARKKPRTFLDVMVDVMYSITYNTSTCHSSLSHWCVAFNMTHCWFCFIFLKRAAGDLVSLFHCSICLALNLFTDYIVHCYPILYISILFDLFSRFFSYLLFIFYWLDMFRTRTSDVFTICCSVWSRTGCNNETRVHLKIDLK